MRQATTCTLGNRWKALTIPWMKFLMLKVVESNKMRKITCDTRMLQLGDNISLYNVIMEKK